MTLPRYEAICEQWRLDPPLHVAVAAVARYFGVLKPRPASGTEEAPQDGQALIDLLGGVGFAKEKPEWLQTTQV